MQDDLDYLSSLNQDEFESFRNELIAKLGVNGIEKIEEIQNENYVRIFDILGGHEGMDKLINFSISYLETTGGWSYVKDLIPNGITKEQSEIYIGSAVYIDKVSRPVYSSLVSAVALSRGQSMCDFEAEARLALVGVNIGVAGMVDIMTGGAGAALTPLESLAVGADLASIWFDYEICNGRWH